MNYKIILFLFFLIINTKIYPIEYSYHEALKQYYKMNLNQPKSEDDGRIQTLNKKGAMSPKIDKATKIFLESLNNITVLEVGGCYGKVMQEALKKHPNVTYHLNDIDKRHLFIAAYNLKTLKLKKSTIKKIKFISGDISKKITTDDKYDAILIARVLHFLSPYQLQNAISNIYDLLKKGGKVYIIAITPYVKRYKNFIPEYEKRIANKHPFPGYVLNLKKWLNKSVTTVNQEQSISDEPFMFLDEEVLIRLFKNRNFKIIECKKIGLTYNSKSWSLDGRENIMMIAEKL